MQKLEEQGNVQTLLKDPMISVKQDLLAIVQHFIYN